MYGFDEHEPILVWANNGDTIVDGHNRYEICRELEAPFTFKALTFANRDEVIDWIIRRQLGRRNLTEEQKSYLRGKQYEGESKPAPGRPKIDKAELDRRAAEGFAQMEADRKWQEEMR